MGLPREFHEHCLISLELDYLKVCVYTQVILLLFRIFLLLSFYGFAKNFQWKIDLFSFLLRSTISLYFTFHRHSTIGYNMLLSTCQIELLKLTLKFLKLKSAQQHYVSCFKSWIGNSEARTLSSVRKGGWICSRAKWSKRIPEGLNASWCRWVVTTTSFRMYKLGIKWAELLIICSLTESWGDLRLIAPNMLSPNSCVV